MNIHCKVFGVFLFLLGIILMILGGDFLSKSQKYETTLKTYVYKDIRAQELKAFIERNWDYSIILSNVAETIEKKVSFSMVEGTPIRKTLLLLSDIWGVKFYLKSHEIYVCFPNEQPPNYFLSEDTEQIYLPPLPVDMSIQFSQSNLWCGPNCLALISYALGQVVSVERVAELAGSDKIKGTTMSGLCQAAQSIGLKAEGRRISLDVLKSINYPVIIHLKIIDGHYVILNNYNNDGTFSIIDCPLKLIIPEEELEKEYTGYALFVWK